MDGFARFDSLLLRVFVVELPDLAFQASFFSFQSSLAKPKDNEKEKEKEDKPPTKNTKVTCQSCGEKMPGGWVHCSGSCGKHIPSVKPCWHCNPPLGQ